MTHRPPLLHPSSWPFALVAGLLACSSAPGRLEAPDRTARGRCCGEGLGFPAAREGGPRALSPAGVAEAEALLATGARCDTRDPRAMVNLNDLNARLDRERLESDLNSDLWGQVHTH